MVKGSDTLGIVPHPPHEGAAGVVEVAAGGVGGGVGNRRRRGDFTRLGGGGRGRGCGRSFGIFLTAFFLARRERRRDRSRGRGRGRGSTGRYAGVSNLLLLQWLMFLHWGGGFVVQIVGDIGMQSNTSVPERSRNLMQILHRLLGNHHRIASVFCTLDMLHVRVETFLDASQSSHIFKSILFQHFDTFQNIRSKILSIHR